MADHTDNALLAAIKALDEVVAPAVDPANPLAGEQLKLVSRYLAFLRSRLQFLADRDRFELHHYLGLAQELRSCASEKTTPSSAEFAQAIELAELAGRRAQATARELRLAIKELTTTISMFVRYSTALEPVAIKRIESVVVRASKSLFDVQRAFYLAMGFEPDPHLVPDLAATLNVHA